MYKIIHLMHKDKFTEPYVKFINANFKPQNHFFILSGGSVHSDAYTSTTNVWQIKTNHRIKLFRQLIRELNTLKFLLLLLFSKRIIIHGLFNDFIINKLSKYVFILKKGNWVIWGGDLYSSNSDPQIENCKAKIIRNIKIVVGIEGDFEYARLKYGFSGVFKKAYYINPVRFDESIIENTSKKNKVYKILAGNSASSTNNHAEIFNVLSKFASQNIMVIAPLSYGNKDYGKDIAAIGKKIFGDKFMALEEFYNEDEYRDILKEIDVAVFNFNRQQGIHTINYLLALGKKIYLPKGISTWDFYTNEVGLKIAPFDELLKADFEQFTLNNYAHQNSVKTKNYFFDENKLVNEWREVFEND